ncbi:putative triple gene block protein 2 [Potexvirus nesignambrosiae]|uniref:Triple gene block protein 2 n=5 Tax=Potexvirus nesignambrosiae TaxID=1417304 RepID=B0FXP7_9VIRU|nr:putative triple gene block protein 2 [Ambrosia asymptomatic virus 1]ABY53442.1 triple gene block protein 2 [Ambrosia asymptomatic virus 1 UKM-2007]AHB87035.1 putative triple gene block protein 2 [Ambrosia asymptomatic virus 1]
MPLQPPPNYIPVLVPIAVGIGLALLVVTFRSNQLPNQGDNIHSLPHGGRYRDGTKQVFYNAPQQFQHTHATPAWALLATVSLALIITCLSRCRHNPVCCTSGPRARVYHIH